METRALLPRSSIGEKATRKLGVIARPGVPPPSGTSTLLPQGEGVNERGGQSAFAGPSKRIEHSKRQNPVLYTSRPRKKDKS